MGSKILAFGSMLLILGMVGVLAVPTFAPDLFPFGIPKVIFIWLASIAVFLFSLRLNITALRRGIIDRMRVINTAVIFVSLALYYVFIMHFIQIPSYVHYIVLGSLGVGFAITFIVYWIWNRRGVY